jgi:hypothetical protein
VWICNSKCFRGPRTGKWLPLLLRSLFKGGALEVPEH